MEKKQIKSSRELDHLDFEPLENPKTLKEILDEGVTHKGSLKQLAAAEEAGVLVSDGPVKH